MHRWWVTFFIKSRKFGNYIKQTYRIIVEWLAINTDFARTIPNLDSFTENKKSRKDQMWRIDTGRKYTQKCFFDLRKASTYRWHGRQRKGLRELCNCSWLNTFSFLFYFIQDTKLYNGGEQMRCTRSTSSTPNYCLTYQFDSIISQHNCARSTWYLLVFTYDSLCLQWGSFFPYMFICALAEFTKKE